MEISPTEAARIKRYLAMPDLSRTPGSPIYELAQRIITLPDFAHLDVIEVPEIVPTSIIFDLFGFAPDHPGRSKSDTYYVDDKNVLRTHTTVMWYYYLNQLEVKKRLESNQAVGSLSYGKVYRKDEIDRHHMNVFHQIDGWYLVPKTERVITVEDLKEVLENMIKAIFGAETKYRFNPDTFPFTDPSIEMEVQVGDRWVEILGAGVVRGSVLKMLGVNPEQYTGWAFGFGLERLAILSMDLPDIRLLWSSDERVKKQLRLGQKFKEVSKYPAITRDISFIVPKTFVANDYFDLIRDLGGDLVEEVELLDKYENDDKFGADKMSYTYRIIYRAINHTLKTEEIDPIQQKVEAETRTQFSAEIR